MADSMHRRQQQKDETRRRILEAAYSVYAEQGFGAATSEVARAAGLSHGGLFVHFPTLDSLITGLLEDFGAAIGARLHGLAEKTDTLDEFLTAHLDVLRTYEAFYTRLISELSLLPATALSLFVSIQSTAAFHFSRVIERETAAGHVRDLKPHLLFNAWIGLLHYYLQNKAFFAPGGSVLERYQDELKTAYLKLVQK